MKIIYNLGTTFHNAPSQKINIKVLPLKMLYVFFFCFFFLVNMIEAIVFRAVTSRLTKVFFATRCRSNQIIGQIGLFTTMKPSAQKISSREYMLHYITDDISRDSIRWFCKRGLCYLIIHVFYSDDATNSPRWWRQCQIRYVILKYLQFSYL